MAVTRVAQGAVATAAASSITPAFGAATTAGNFLVLYVAGTGSGVDITVPTGWTKVTTFGDQTGSANGTAMGAAILIKPNCGASETAPTVNFGTSTQLWAMLEEWSGMGGASAPTTFDQLGSQQGATAGVALTSPGGGDSTPNNLLVACFAIAGSKSQTLTLNSVSVTPAGGTSPSTQTGSFATKQIAHALFFSQVMSSNASQDTITPSITPSTGTIAYNFYGLSFAPPTPPRGPMGPPIVRAQAVMRAANF